jgi:polyisoprenoid-binding protein YceI
MKKIFLIAPVALFTVLTSCEGETKSETTEIAVVAENVVAKNYVLNTLESTIEWQGEGVGHGHKGNLSINKGKFIIENDAVTQGTLEIDMTSLTVSSIPAEEEENGKLVGHLTTGDFFNVAEFPTATLTITDGTDMNNIKANLTIKEVTDEVTFALSSAEENGVITLTSSLKVDRTKFGVIYSSGNFFEDLGDHLIDDEFTLNVTLVSK